MKDERQERQGRLVRQETREKIKTRETRETRDRHSSLSGNYSRKATFTILAMSNQISMIVLNLLFALISWISFKVDEEEEIVVSNPSFLTKFNQLIQKTPKKIQVEKNPFNGDFLYTQHKTIIFQANYFIWQVVIADLVDLSNKASINNQHISLSCLCVLF